MHEPNESQFDIALLRECPLAKLAPSAAAESDAVMVVRTACRRSNRALLTPELFAMELASAVAEWKRSAAAPGVSAPLLKGTAGSQL